jgi:signal transduction histidine kinase
MNKAVPETILELVEEERKFLHDLANPLAIASGMLEAYRDELTRSGIPSTEALERKLSKTESALQRVGDLLKNHRPRLIEILAAAQQTDSSKPLK